MAIDIKQNVLLLKGSEGRDHIPPMPLFMAIIHGVQLLLSFIVLILCAYASANILTGYYTTGNSLAFFGFTWSLFFFIYISIFPLFLPKFYIYWIHLGLLFSTTLFWLSTFASLASQAVAWDNLRRTWSIFLDTELLNEGPLNAIKAGAALGAINWALFMFSIVYFGISLHRFRAAELARRRGDIEIAQAATFQQGGVVQVGGDKNMMEGQAVDFQPVETTGGAH